MPLNTFQDAVGPIAKSIRELALVLDQVTGPDAEDEATADAGAPRRRLVRRRRSTRSALKGARIGVLRQLFVGVTGEREAAATMETRRSANCGRRARPSSTSRFRISTRATCRRAAARPAR